MCQGQLRVLHQGVPVYFVTMPLCRFVCTVRGADFGTLLEHLACQSQNLVNKWVRCVRAQAPRADRFAPQTPLRPLIFLLLETLRTGGWEWCQLERSDLKSLGFAVYHDVNVDHLCLSMAVFSCLEYHDVLVDRDATDHRLRSLMENLSVLQAFDDGRRC